MLKPTHKCISSIPIVSAILILLQLFSCTPKKKVYKEVLLWDSIQVTATAYNSLPSQTTSSNSDITAWGDTLKPGMKCIAVSRDLIRLGLKHNTMVRIDTASQIYLVKDKMHTRWRKRIDIYKGTDRTEALEWGRRKVKLYYVVKKDSMLVTEKTS